MTIGKIDVRHIAFAGIVALCLIIPYIIHNTYYISFFILILTYVLISGGWNIIGGFAGYNSFGHSFYFGIGAYATAFLIYTFNLNIFVALAIGTAVAGLMALPLGYPALRLRGLYFALSTVPISYVGLYLILLLPYFGGAQGILIKPIFTFDPFTNAMLYYVLFLVAAISTVLMTYKVQHSKFGLGLLSIREDEESARTCGVHVARLKVYAYALSAIPLALAGGLYVCYNGYIDPPTTFSLSVSLYAIGLTYIGGRATVLGPIVGSIVYIFFSEYFRYSVLGSIPGLDTVILAIVLILIILLVPQGIVGYLRQKFLVLRRFIF